MGMYHIYFNLNIFLIKIPEGLIRAQKLQRDTAKESPESAPGAEVERSKDGFDGGGGRHR